MVIGLFVLLLAQTVVYVPRPSPATKVYEGQGLTFRYPQNWQLEEKQGRVMVFPAQGRLPTRGGHEFFTHGIFVGFYQPTWRGDLRSATYEVFNAFAQGNPSTQKIDRTERRLQVAGRDALILEYVTPNAPSPSGPEQGVLLTVQEAHGIWFWVMFAPAAELKAYRYTFSAVADSIGFEQETDLESGEHAEHTAIVERVVAKLQENKFRLPPFRVMISNQVEINAYAQTDYRLVILPVAMVHFLHGSEGELAFVIAHELGHLADQECAAALRANRTVAQIRTCEARADEIGLQYLVGAGYNAYDAAAFFGRMMMFTGQTSLLSSFFQRFTSDHPIDLDRISGLRKTLARYCQQTPGACSQVQ